MYNVSHGKHKKKQKAIAKKKFQKVLDKFQEKQ